MANQRESRTCAMISCGVHNESHGGTITMKTKTNNDRVTNVNWLDMPGTTHRMSPIMSAGPHYHNANEFARNANGSRQSLRFF